MQVLPRGSKVFKLPQRERELIWIDYLNPEKLFQVSSKYNEKQMQVLAEDDAYIFVYKPAGISCLNDEFNNTIHFNKQHKNNNDTKKNKKIPPSFYEIFQKFWTNNHPFQRFMPPLLHGMYTAKKK